MKIAAFLLLVSVSACAGDITPFLQTNWDASRLREEFRPKSSGMLFSFWLFDRGHREGRGNSDATTSGDLAWGEGHWLMDYIMCYMASRDTYWLDKVVDHFDRMMCCLSDPEGDGFLAWRDRLYSVGLVQVIARQNTEGLTIEPEVSKLWMNRGGDKVTGHKYSITFKTADIVEIRDETEDKLIATKQFKGTLDLIEIPGAKFKITGNAKPGARFDLDSTPGEEIEYQVHDGMITYPIAQFIEIVFNDSSLHARYKKKADEYLAFIDKHIRQKWEPTWVNLPEECGAYIFTRHKTQRFPGGLLPHNQYLALARTYIVLKDVPGVPNPQVYLEKATKMARYFKKNLRPNGNAYVWNYWDPYPPIPEVRLHIEDTGHGSIDIGFAAEACNRKVVFTDEDLIKFSNTYAEVMWNKSTDDPLIAGIVDGRTSRHDSRNIREWVKLAQWNPKVWEIAMLMHGKNTPASLVPSLLYMVAGMAGIESTAIERYRQMKAQAEKDIASGAPFNGDFEWGDPATQTPYGWTLQTWSKCEGKAAWVEGGYQSAHAIMLEGIKGNINVVAVPMFHASVDRPTKFRMSVFYRTEGDARPCFSFIGCQPGTSAPKQYDTSPPLEKSVEWKKAQWEATSAPGIKEVYFILRNHGAGKVFYDDFHMEKEN